MLSINMIIIHFINFFDNTCSCKETWKHVTLTILPTNYKRIKELNEKTENWS